MAQTYDLIILGGGPAGIYGAYYAGLRHLRTLLIERTSVLGGAPIAFYAQKDVYDYPGAAEGMTGAEIVEGLRRQLETVGKYVSIVKETDVTKVDLGEDGVVLTAGGETIGAKGLILATGTGAFEPIRLLDLPASAALKYHVSDIREFVGKRLVVLGGGDSAVDWANTFAARRLAASVAIVHRRADWRAKQRNVDALARNGVSVLTERSVAAVGAHELTLKVGETDREEKLPYDALLVQFGQESVGHPYGDLAITTERRRYVVKSNMQTSHRRVFAVGSCCIYDGKVNVIATALGEAVTAVEGVLFMIDPKAAPTFYASMKPRGEENG